MHSLGLAVMMCGGLIWVLGAKTVRKAHFRRMGREPLISDLSLLWLTKLNAHEKRRLFFFMLAAVALGLLGSGMANGVFD